MFAKSDVILSNTKLFTRKKICQRLYKFAKAESDRTVGPVPKELDCSSTWPAGLVYSISYVTNSCKTHFGTVPMWGQCIEYWSAHACSPMACMPAIANEQSISSILYTKQYYGDNPVYFTMARSREREKLNRKLFNPSCASIYLHGRGGFKILGGWLPPPLLRILNRMFTNVCLGQLLQHGAF